MEKYFLHLSLQKLCSSMVAKMQVVIEAKGGSIYW